MDIPLLRSALVVVVIIGVLAAIAIPMCQDSRATARDRGEADRRSVTDGSRWREFTRRRDGMIHAMDGGLWLHRHLWFGRPLAHLVSTDRDALLAYGREVGLPEDRLQFKPLKDPRTNVRRPAWHWDLGGPYLPPRA